MNKMKKVNHHITAVEFRFFLLLFIWLFFIFLHGKTFPTSYSFKNFHISHISWKLFRKTKFTPKDRDNKISPLLCSFKSLEDMQTYTQQPAVHLYSFSRCSPFPSLLLPAFLFYVSMHSHTHTYTHNLSLCYTPSFVWIQSALKADPVALLRRMLICPLRSLWGGRKWTLAANALSHWPCSLCSHSSSSSTAPCNAMYFALRIIGFFVLMCQTYSTSVGVLSIQQHDVLWLLRQQVHFPHWPNLKMFEPWRLM